MTAWHLALIVQGLAIICVTLAIILKNRRDLKDFYALIEAMEAKGLDGSKEIKP